MSSLFSVDRLDNGLRLVIAPDSTAPVAAVNVTFGTGTRHERAGETEYAHLLEHLLFQAEQSRLVRAAGGSTDAYTDTDCTSYYTAAPSHQVEVVLWLEAQRLARVAGGFTEEQVRHECEVVRAEHTQRRLGMPYGTALPDLLECAFPPGHPHHTSMAARLDLGHATSAGVVAFAATHYVPGNAVIAVVGDVDPAEVRDWAETHFGAIPAGPAPPVTTPFPAVPDGEVRNEVSAAVPLPRACVGWRAPAEGTPEYDALLVAVAVTAAGRTARLRRRLVGTVAADVGLTLLGRIGGSFVHGHVTALPGVPVAVAEHAFHDVFDDIRAGTIDDVDMDRAIALLEHSHLAQVAGFGGRAVTYAKAAVRFDDPGWAESRVACLRAVTRDEVALVANTVFRPENRVVRTFVTSGTP